MLASAASKPNQRSSPRAWGWSHRRRCTHRSELHSSPLMTRPAASKPAMLRRRAVQKAPRTDRGRFDDCVSSVRWRTRAPGSAAGSAARIQIGLFDPGQRSAHFFRYALFQAPLTCGWNCSTILLKRLWWKPKKMTETRATTKFVPSTAGSFETCAGAGMLAISFMAPKPGFCTLSLNREVFPSGPIASAVTILPWKVPLGSMKKKFPFASATVLPSK